eukprot:3319550-Amphidinium_carterae.2
MSCSWRRSRRRDCRQPACSVFKGMLGATCLCPRSRQWHPTRDQEVDHVKRDPFLRPGSMGLVRKYQETSPPQAQVTTDLRQ